MSDDKWFIQQLLDLEREEPLSSSLTVDFKVELSEEKLQMIKDFFEDMEFNRSELKIFYG